MSKLTTKHKSLSHYEVLIQFRCRVLAVIIRKNEVPSIDTLRNSHVIPAWLSIENKH